MPSHCYVSKCRGNNKRSGERVSVFKFPEDVEVRNKWIEAIPRRNFKPTKSSKVCILHFNESDIERTTWVYHSETGEKLTAKLRRPRLKTNAVPSIFPGCPEYSSVTEQPVSSSAPSKTLSASSSSKSMTLGASSSSKTLSASSSSKSSTLGASSSSKSKILSASSFSKSKTLGASSSSKSKTLGASSAASVNMSNYKYCSVLECTNTSVRTPGKLFVSVPFKMRNKWLRAAGRDPRRLSPKSVIKFCEDHFDLKKDMLNYMEWSMTGTVKKIRLRDGCLPTKFDCQRAQGKTETAPLRSAVVKRRKIAVTEECNRILEEYRINEEKAQGITLLQGNDNDSKGGREVDSDSSSSDERSNQQAGSSTSQQEPPPPVIKTEPLTDVEPLPNVSEVHDASTSTQYVIGKRNVNVNYLIKSLQKLNDHGGANCNFSDMTICGEKTEGSNYGVELSCRICFNSAVVWLEDPDDKPIRPNLSHATTVPQDHLASLTSKFRWRKPNPHPRKTPTPPPDDPVQNFLVPLPLARSSLLPQSKEVPKVITTNQSHLTNVSLINPPQLTPFIKQEVIDDSSMSQGTSSIPPSSSDNPAKVQLLFFVDQPGSSQTAPGRGSSVESITVTPDIVVGNQNYSATSLGASATSESMTILPDIYPAEVLPVDLNLVKKEIEDDQSMDVNDNPGVCLVPMSVTSLDPSQTFFALENPKSPNSAEILEASSSANGITISTATSCTKTSETFSETATCNVPTEYSTPTAGPARPKYKRLVVRENAKSHVWKYFGLPADENGLIVDNHISVCKICKKSFNYSKGKSTSNMVYHLRTRHPLKYMNMLKMSEQCKKRYSTLVKKRNPKSIIWKHFKLPADKNGIIIDDALSVCDICKNCVSSKNGSTSSMFAHLKLHHPLQYKESISKTLSSNQNEVGSVKQSTSIEVVDITKATPENAISVTENPVSSGTRDSENPKCDEFLKMSNSVIWKHFSLPTDDKKIVICKICDQYVVYKSVNTAFMFYHLKSHHPSICNSLCEGSNSSVPSTYSSNKREVSDISPIKNLQDTKNESLGDAKPSALKEETCLMNCQPLDSYSSNNCVESITKFLVFTLQPYTLVERKSFINMIRNINPSYQIPSKKYFSKVGIPNLYNEALEQLQQEISVVNVKEISMTVDCWKSVANTPYIAITIHFIDNQWNLKSACINCTHFDVNHTYTNISSSLTSALSNWGFDVANVTYCTADNSSNLVKVMSHLRLPLISCFGHNLNAGIHRALGIPCLEKSVLKLKQLQNAISQSSTMKRDLSGAQKSLQMEVVSLPVAFPTRWRSTQKLIRRFLSNRVPICKMLDGYPYKKQFMLDESEVSALEDFISNTQLLENVTTTLSGEEYISASSIWPLYRKIKKNLQCQDSGNELSKQIKSEILSVLSERYEEESVKTSLWMASFCDPRFRLNFTDNASDVKTIALQKMTCVYKAIDKPQTSQPDPQKKGLEKLFEFEDDNDSSPANKAQAELNKYLSMAKINLNVSPFSWWKLHEDSFPALKILARKYLAIQGSSVSSDRVFSTIGDTITRQRAALLPKHAEMQIFLAENQKKCF